MAKFCSQCGAQLADDANFCTVCGTNVGGGGCVNQPTAAATYTQPTAAATSIPTTVVTGSQPTAATYVQPTAAVTYTQSAVQPAAATYTQSAVQPAAATYTQPTVQPTAAIYAQPAAATYTQSAAAPGTQQPAAQQATAQPVAQPVSVSQARKSNAKAIIGGIAAVVAVGAIAVLLAKVFPNWSLGNLLPSGSSSSNTSIAQIAAGLLFIALGVIFYLVSRRKVARCTASGTATIVDIIRKRSSGDDDSDSYIPVLGYVVNGKEYRERADELSSSRRKANRVGDTVPIRFNPNRPSEFIADGKKGGGFGIGFIIVGIIVIIVPLIVN